MDACGNPFEAPRVFSAAASAARVDLEYEKAKKTILPQLCQQVGRWWGQKLRLIHENASNFRQIPLSSKQSLSSKEKASADPHQKCGLSTFDNQRQNPDFSSPSFPPRLLGGSRTRMEEEEDRKVWFFSFYENGIFRKLKTGKFLSSFLAPLFSCFSWQEKPWLFYKSWQISDCFYWKSKLDRTRLTAISKPIPKISFGKASSSSLFFAQINPDKKNWISPLLFLASQASIISTLNRPFVSHTKIAWQKELRTQGQKLRSDDHYQSFMATLLMTWGWKEEEIILCTDFCSKMQVFSWS